VWTASARMIFFQDYEAVNFLHEKTFFAQTGLSCFARQKPCAPRLAWKPVAADCQVEDATRPQFLCTGLELRVAEGSDS